MAILEIRYVDSWFIENHGEHVILSERVLNLVWHITKQIEQCNFKMRLEHILLLDETPGHQFSSTLVTPVVHSSKDISPTQYVLVKRNATPETMAYYNYSGAYMVTV